MALVPGITISLLATIWLWLAPKTQAT